jgi:5,10-methylenetetrahydromethanopterin reductase
MGLEPTPLVDLEAAVSDLRTLWRGEAVVNAASGSPYRLSYLDHPLKIPVYLAASGPRLLALAGRIADGVIILVGTDVGAVRTAVGHVATGAKEVGRSLNDVHVVLWCSASIHADGSYARDLVRPQVASTIMQTKHSHLPPEEAADVERVRRAYDYYDHNVVGSSHARLVTDALADRFSLAGTPDECRSRLRMLSTTGINQVSIVPFVPPGEDRSEVLHAFASVMSSMP